ncbi:MAG: hypothetical protein WC949_03460 [Candidatus Paceibacterota bacterium]|jgi:hypothetical protein
MDIEITILTIILFCSIGSYFFVSDKFSNVRRRRVRAKDKFFKLKGSSPGVTIDYCIKFELSDENNLPEKDKYMPEKDLPSPEIFLDTAFRKISSLNLLNVMAIEKKVAKDIKDIEKTRNKPSKIISAEVKISNIRKGRLPESETRSVPITNDTNKRGTA